MKPIFFLLALSPLLLCADDKPPTVKPSRDWERKIAAFEAADKKRPPPRGAVLFIGASGIARWKTLEEDFPKHKVINRGIAGSQIADSLYYADRIVIPYAPRMVVLFAGGNDLNSGKSEETVFSDFKAFATKVRAALPDVRIAYLSIAPSPARWKQRGKIQRVNTMIEDYIKGQANMRFIDGWTPFLTESGTPREDLYVEDGLHNNAEGYKLRVRIVEPYLDEK